MKDSLEATFRRDILQHPEDDRPRLIYADWLEENGDPRGRFIRVQCALAGDLSLPERARCWIDEEALLREFGEQWAADISSLVVDYRFQRGFIEAVTLSDVQWWRHADQLMRREPIIDVSLTTDSSDRSRRPYIVVPRLEISHRLTEFRRLRYLSVATNDEGLETLVQAAALENLRGLNLDYSRLTDRGLQTLLEGRWSRLESLSLRGLILTQDRTAVEASISPLVREMLATKRWPELRRLDVRDCFLDPPAIAILRARFGPGLQV